MLTRISRRAVFYAALLLIALGVNAAVATDFFAFVGQRSTASEPFISTDYIALVRGGVTYKVPGTALLQANNKSVAINGHTLVLGGALSLALSDLSDITISSPSNGQVLTYSTSLSKWINSAPAAAAAKQRLGIGWPAGIDPGNNIIATVDEASTVTSIVGTVSAAVGAAATVSVYKAASNIPCSSGTVLHSGSFDANGTPNTNQTLTLTTTTLSAGDRLCLVTANGSNWLAGSGIGEITARITTP